MTEEQKKNNRRRAENEAVCTSFAIQEGLAGEYPNISEIHFISRMAHYIFDEDHEPFVYSWDDGYMFGSVPVQKIAETVITRMRVTGFLLRENGRAADTSIHIWTDGDTIAFVLAENLDETSDLSAANEDYEAIAAVSYTASTGHHFDLLNENYADSIDFSRFLEDGRRLSGFPSYPSHSMIDYLSKTGMTEYFRKDGTFRPLRYPDGRQRGDEVFEATEEALSILSLLV